MPVISCIKEKLERLNERIDAAAKKGGRTLKDIRLVAVTKGASIEAVQHALEAGIVEFGENRLQEAELKVPLAQAQWHMVGHLQSNKVARSVSLFSMIQSVDTVRLAERINAEAAAQNKIMPVLLEVRISPDEEQKYGFLPEELYGAVDEIAEFSNLVVKGLMGIAPNTADPEPRRAAFKKLKNLFSVCKTIKKERVAMEWLSMGMSDDFEVAIEEGSNMIRIGRLLFK